MHCYKLTIAYDGTNYSGWQIQPNASSIQQKIQEALCILLKKEKVVLVGSGRTDAGVHAKGQVAHFHFQDYIDLSRLHVSLNGLLPRDIRIKAVEPVSPRFHSQYSAIRKEYHYYLHLNRVMDPFQRLYSWHFQRKIDVNILKKAAILFTGTHDFTSFANEAHRGTAAKNPVRTLYRLDIKPNEGGLRLEFEGDGFLYKMVRNIVGTLMDVASHKRAIEEIDQIFAAKNRRQASLAAPPEGLFLIQVFYENENGCLD
ncbi:tRNA pseudouridine(38-40) synthase TruA [Candidatus Protochlamydia amoebophila]|uniref:tRNA pseudouridine(38-40) synthase TruA n=1 Tax=Candidatus Protochlamydia amoebophila TaxID=362787 RepID=UPI001BC8F0A6|nr:tRNA pseudouridine(38-40) synthase TruA [Candidatus Protochlamydia amoebophila]